MFTMPERTPTVRTLWPSALHATLLGVLALGCGPVGPREAAGSTPPALGGLPMMPPVFAPTVPEPPWHEDGSAEAKHLGDPSLPVQQPAPVTSGTWVAQGPGPTLNGQVENISPNNEVVGAIRTVLAHPTNPDILYVGAVNGGVWRTLNATAASPTWQPLTDTFPSLSIGALALDPSNPSSLVAGVGQFSSFRMGGPLTGLLRSTDGGNTWTQIEDPLLVGQNISGVAVRCQTLLVTSNSPGGVFRSTDGGASWTAVSGTGGLPAGIAFDLVGDPSNNDRFYVSIAGVGVFRSDDLGVTWTNVTANDPAGLNAAITGGGNDNTRMAVASNGRVYVGVVVAGQLQAIGFSDDQGATWTDMDLPQTLEGGVVLGIHTNRQGALHFSIAADPGDPNRVYVGGDVQQGGFPNSIGANNFTGRLFRGDTTVAATGAVPSPQWAHLTHSNAIATIPAGGTASDSAPHADSRGMAFDANGNLYEVDDGGIYRRTSPGSNTGDWFSINGNLQTTELHDIAYDSNSNILIGGAQDTGTPEQITPGGTTWTEVSMGDGGDVAVDDRSTPGQSIRYSSFQNLADFRRRTYDAANNFISQTTIALTVTGGGAQLVPLFVTPIALNEIDPTRLVIVGANSIYESFDRGDTITEIGPGQGPGFFSAQNAVAYGGRRGGVDNPDVLYVGVNSQVLVRTTAGAALTVAAPLPGGDQVRDIVLDPSDWMTAYVADNDQVFQTTDAGTTWSDITGNLGANAANFRSLSFVEGTSFDRLIVGTGAGTFVSVDSAFGVWFRLGSGLPNAPVWDLDYDAADDVLAAGTLGRSAWTLSGVSTTNVPPIARCADATVPTAPGQCSANASIDNGSFDPEGGPLTLAQTPPGPYSLGTTDVTLTATDNMSASSSCEATVTVVDHEAPTIQCHAPATILPWDAPISFSASAADNCDVSNVTITGTDCFSFTNEGDRVDKTGSCQVELCGNTITIIDPGGVDDHIRWTVVATDSSGNSTSTDCEVVVANQCQH